MKSMKTLACGGAIAAGLLAFAAPAQAGTYVTYNSATDASFGDTAPLPASFTDTFDISFGTAGSGTITIFAQNKTVAFTSGTIGSYNFTFDSCLGGYACTTLDNVALSAGSNTLTLKGTRVAANASYFGNVTFTPAVPEPAAWAMMIGGIGLVGGMMRRRTKVSFAAA